MKYTVSSDGIDLTVKLQKYVGSKVASLEKYVPKHARESAEIDIHLRFLAPTDEKECRFSLILPHETLVVTEATGHSYAAIDIVVAEMRRRIRVYKEKHEPKAIRHRIARKTGSSKKSL